MDKANVGQYGEHIAAKFLKKKGYKILERNLHISHQEIDIVAINCDYIVFVEVKTRVMLPENADVYSTPGAAVTYQKQIFLLSAARKYLSQNRYELQPRMDVIEVYLAPENSLRKTEKFYEKFVGLFGKNSRKVLRINHIENAFGLHGYRP